MSCYVNGVSVKYIIVSHSHERLPFPYFIYLKSCTGWQKALSGLFLLLDSSYGWSFPVHCFSRLSLWPLCGAMILTSHACAYGSRSHMTRQYSCTNRVNGIVRPSWVLENTQYHWTINTHTWEWYCVCKMALYKLSIVVVSCVVSCCISLCDFVLRFVVLCCFGCFVLRNVIKHVGI